MPLSTTYTKAETDYLLQQIDKKVVGGYKGDLRISDPAPTEIGYYILLDVGTYTNLGGIVVSNNNNLNFASFDGTTWSKVEVDILIPLSSVLDPLNETEAVTGKAAADYIVQEIVKNDLETNYTFLTPKKENVGFLELSSNYLWVDKSQVIAANVPLFSINVNYSKINTNRLFIALATIDESNVFNIIERKELMGDTIGINSHNLSDVFDLESYGEDLYLMFYGVNDLKSVAGKSKIGSQILAFEPFTANTGTMSVINNFELSVYLSVQYNGESLDYRIKELEDQITSKPKLDLPRFIDTYVGGHFQIFKKNIINYFDSKSYYIKVTTDKKIGGVSIGKDYIEYWECFITELGNFNATFTLYNASGAILDSKVVGVRIKTKPIVLTMPNVMFIGDSLTFYNRLPDEFHRLLTGTSTLTTTPDTLSPQTLALPQGHGYTGVTLKGTQKTNFKGWVGQQFNEGYSGYSSLDFISSGSPFFIGGALNFSQYLTNNSIGQLDAIFIGLGWNDITRYSASESKTYLQSLISNIRLALPSVKIFVWSENMPSLNGGLGNHPWGSDVRVNLIDLRNKMFELHTVLKELTDVIYVDANAQFDSENGTQFENYIANFRVRTQEKRGVDDVHPNDAGFFQIADACLRSFLYYN